MKYFLIVLIKIYQKTISPDHGWLRFKYPYGFCKFYPTCSQYAIEVIKLHGVVKGLFLTAIRVVKCNPFSAPKINKPI